MSEKILSRIKSAVTGEEYYIGTTGSEEHVAVKLTAPGEVDWTEHSVEVEIPELEQEHSYPLSASGECTFSVPMGERYIVVLPTIEGYATPHDITLHATLPSRSLTHAYTTHTQTEQVLVQARVIVEGGGYDHTRTDMEGLTCILTTGDGETMTADFNSSLEALFSVPYGTTYSIRYPYCEGYRLMYSTSDEHTAGMRTRIMEADYIEEEVGIYAFDADGNKYYTPEEIESLADPSVVRYLYINTAVLQASSRNDGTQGNGFILDMADNTPNGQWAGSTVEFDTALLPYLTAASQTTNKTYYAGVYNTQAIISIGDDRNISTPAADNCYARSITIDGVTHKGFLWSYGQAAQAVANVVLLRALTTATGRTLRNYMSGHWWTSCQYSATHAVNLLNGGFDYYLKTPSANVMCAYDL